MTTEMRSSRPGLVPRALVSTLSALALAAGCGATPETGDDITVTSEPIISGTNATAGQYPWQVYLLYGGTQLCGGSLLAPDWVLTAGHCMFDGGTHLPVVWTSLTVRLGEIDTTVPETGEQDRFVAIPPIIRPGFNGDPTQGDADPTPHNDMALLKLSSPIVYDGHSRPIRPAIGQDTSGTAIATGWGATKASDPTQQSSTVLKQVSLPLQTNAACIASMRLHRTMFDDEICAGEVSGNDGGATCNGDSGGPLALQRPSGAYELVGVSSWGPYNCPPPSVFSRVSYASNWIRHYVADPAWDAQTELLLM